MRVRLILEHGGHAISKRAELPEAPTVGALILAGRERRVVSVEQHAGRGETDVCLCEDVADLMMHIDAAAHLACVELMKRDWWEIEKEALRVCLRERIGLHAVG